MKTTLFGKSLVLATFLAVLTVGSVWIAQPDEAAAMNCRCLPMSQTSIIHTDDVTCAAAHQRLWSELEAAAGCQDFCTSQVVVTMACTPNPGGGYWIGGYLNYQCEVCIGIPDM